jgi:3',5'-cyclic-AMP phosphodiesterase
MLTFIHISDTHISQHEDYRPHWVRPDTPPPNPAARALVTQINALPFEPAFVLHTGDVTADPDPLAYEMAASILGGIRWPVLYVPGNHDNPVLLQQIVMGRERPRVPMEEQIYIDGMEIITLESTQGATHAPTLSDAQLAQLRALGTGPRPRILALHHPLLPVGIPYLDDRMRVQNGVEAHSLLQRAGVRAVFSGHIHQRVTAYHDGIVYATAPSTYYPLAAYPGLVDETQTNEPPGFNLVIVDEDRVFVRSHVLERVDG